MRPLLALVSLAGAALLSVAAPIGAIAAPTESPLDLAGAYVLDASGALDGSEAEVEDALDGLYAEANTALFVVVVDRFENPSDPVDWATETAIASGLGDADVLLALASGDREYAWSVSDSFPLTDAELEDIAQSALIPALRTDDYVGGLTATAVALGDALTSEPEPVPNTPGSSDAGGGIPIVPIVGGVAAVGVGAFVVTRFVRKGRKMPGSTASPSDETRAGSLLLALDDKVRESEQELGFAEAQFGARAVAGFSAALTEAKAKLQQAFEIRQRLDDATPETAEEKAALTAQIVALCENADAALETQIQSFAELRGVETSAPQQLEAVTAAQATIGAKVDAAATTVAELTSRFGAAAVDSVDENPAQARELAAFAAERIAAAGTALAASNSSDAAIAVRDAQQAVGQATQLLQAVTELAAELPQTAERLTTASSALTATLAEAKAAPADAALSTAITAADRALSGASSGDPAAGLLAVEQATTALASALSASRDAEARSAASREQYERLRLSTVQRIRQAEGYITTRRGGVGTAARTRLAEAHRLLAHAARQVATDPDAAAATALEASNHAEQAFRLARSDVASFGASPAARAGGAIATGAVLGGIARSSIRRPNSPAAGSASSKSRRPSTGGTSRRQTGSERGGRRGSGGRF